MGKFLSVDPLTKEYPELTPYQFASNCPIEAIDLDGLEQQSNKVLQFAKDFGKSALNGIGNGISYIMNNPNHAGYSNGVQPNTGKPPTQAEIKRYDFSIVQQFDPHYQIENFSNNLVFGTGNFVGGIIDGDGARTAQAIPPLLGAVGTIAGVKGLKVSTAAKSKTTTMYRGVNENNVGYNEALKGSATPNGGFATPLEHNTTSTLNSPFTSWTPNPEVALNYALRPQGVGVVLTAQIPNSKIVASPNTKKVQLIQNPSVVVSESEVLVKGKVTNANVKKETPKKK